MSKLKICEDCLYKIFRYVSKNDRCWYDSCECSEEECQGVDGSDAEIVVGMNQRIADLEAQVAHKDKVIDDITMAVATLSDSQLANRVYAILRRMALDKAKEQS